MCIDARSEVLVVSATWQRCRVHFMRNVLAHAGKQGRRVVAAFIGTAFAQDDAEAARAQWRQVADQLRPRVKKLAELMDEAESDVLAYMSFSPAHRPIQLTKDLPGFWRGSWSDVRKDMRGRYPRHPWPEDPAVAPPTTRVKPRGQ